MFPTDAITEFYELAGAGQIDFATSTRTILGISIQQSSVASNSYSMCNGNIFALNYSRDFSFNPINYVCNGVFSIGKTGVDSAAFIITYVPRDISSSTNASTSQLFINGFSYGEVLTIMLLIFIFSAVFFSTLKNWIFGVKNDGIMRVISDKTRI